MNLVETEYGVSNDAKGGERVEGISKEDREFLSTEAQKKTADSPKEKVKGADKKKPVVVKFNELLKVAIATDPKKVVKSADLVANKATPNATVTVKHEGPNQNGQSVGPELSKSIISGKPVMKEMAGATKLEGNDNAAQTVKPTKHQDVRRVSSGKNLPKNSADTKVESYPVKQDEDVPVVDRPTLVYKDAEGIAVEVHLSTDVLEDETVSVVPDEQVDVAPELVVNEDEEEVRDNPMPQIAENDLRNSEQQVIVVTQQENDDNESAVLTRHEATSEKVVVKQDREEGAQAKKRSVQQSSSNIMLAKHDDAKVAVMEKEVNGSPEVYERELASTSKERVVPGYGPGARGAASQRAVQIENQVSRAQMQKPVGTEALGTGNAFKVDEMTLTDHRAGNLSALFEGASEEGPNERLLGQPKEGSQTGYNGGRNRNWSGGEGRQEDKPEERAEAALRAMNLTQGQKGAAAAKSFTEAMETVRVSSQGEMVSMIMKQVERFRESGKSWVRVNLDMPEGDSVTMNIQVRDEAIKVRFGTEDRGVEEHLKGVWQGLQETAAENGIKLESADFYHKGHLAVI